LMVILVVSLISGCVSEASGFRLISNEIEFRKKSELEWNLSSFYGHRRTPLREDIERLSPNSEEWEKTVE
jgi:hypothetical protein